MVKRYCEAYRLKKETAPPLRIPTYYSGVKVVIPGVPPNWSNSRYGSHYQRGKDVAYWRDLSYKLAHSARNGARWPLPVKCDPPAPRFIEVDIYKHGPLYDMDGAMSCLKPLVDGLQGALVYRDDDKWLKWLSLPRQHPADEKFSRVEIKIHLVDPRS